ncbi:MAG: hypothetical protein Phyf2KO_18410 [Phycisphaerales bacterium]
MLASTSTLVGLFVLTLVSANPYKYISFVPIDRVYAPSQNLLDDAASAEATSTLSTLIIPDATLRAISFILAKPMPSTLRDAYEILLNSSAAILGLGFMFAILSVVYYLRHREEETGTFNASVEFIDLAEQWGVQQPSIASVRSDFLFDTLIAEKRSLIKRIFSRRQRLMLINTRVVLATFFAFIRHNKKTKTLLWRLTALILWFCRKGISSKTFNDLYYYFAKYDWRRGPTLSKDVILADYGVSLLPIGHELERIALIYELSELRHEEQQKILAPIRIVWMIGTTLTFLMLCHVWWAISFIPGTIGTIGSQSYPFALVGRPPIEYALFILFVPISMLWPNFLRSILCYLRRATIRRWFEESLKETLDIIHSDAKSESKIYLCEYRVSSTSYEKEKWGRRVRGAVNEINSDDNYKQYSIQTEEDYEIPTIDLNEYVRYTSDLLKYNEGNSQAFTEAMTRIQMRNYSQARERYMITNEILDSHLESNETAADVLIDKLRNYSIHRDSSLDVLIRSSAFYLQYADGFIDEFLNGLGIGEMEYRFSPKGMPYHAAKNTDPGLQGESDANGLQPIAWRSMISAYYATQQLRTSNWNLWVRVKRCEHLFILGIVLVLTAVASIAALRGSAALDTPPAHRIHFGDSLGEPIDPASLQE